MRRRCQCCGSHNVWDRALYLDTDGNVTTYPARARVMESVICLSCKHLQSLGPARDTEQTAIEVRAAELAHGIDNEAEFANCEWMGWNGDEVYSSGGSYHTIDKLPLRNLHEWHAGYLARCIATHDDGGTP